MLFESVCVCSTCFKIYTNLPCGKSMLVFVDPMFTNFTVYFSTPNHEILGFEHFIT